MRLLSSIKPLCEYSIVPTSNDITIALGTVKCLKAAGKADMK